MKIFIYHNCGSLYPSGSWFGQTWNHLTWGCFHIISAYLVKRFLRRCLKNINKFSLIEIISLLKKKDALCQVKLKLTQWFWIRWKCGKFTTSSTPTTYMTRKAHFFAEEDNLKIVRLFVNWTKMLKINDKLISKS